MDSALALRVTASIAVVELVALVAAGIALFGKPLVHKAQDVAIAHALPTSSEPKRTSPQAPRLARSETSVLVLNGNGRSGAAGTEADRIRAHGYLVGGIGNAPRSDYARTLVMFRPGYEPEARRFARDLHVPIVAPLDGLRPAELMGAHLVIVLGS